MTNNKQIQNSNFKNMSLEIWHLEFVCILMLGICHFKIP